VLQVAATDETQPVQSSGDSADDPAIWVHPTDPGASLIIGNDKLGALETYDLDGSRVQRITTETRFWGNVDVRGDLVAAWNGKGVRVFRVDASTRQLVRAAEGDGLIPAVAGEGLCLWQSPTALNVVVISRAGVLRQLELIDPDGDALLEGREVRKLSVGSEAEGCVADDANGRLYVSEEDVGLWRYGADPATGQARSLVDPVAAANGHIAADAEGVTLAGDHLVVSAQNTSDGTSSYFAIYERDSNAFVKAFRVEGGTAADDCDTTDGIAAHAGDLGPDFPGGVFVCQDGANGAPGTAGNQNFKLVPWPAVLAMITVSQSDP
jgi:3-phytase